LQPCFFVQQNFYRGADAPLTRACNQIWPTGWPLGLHPKVFGIGVRALVALALLLVLWQLRAPIARFLSSRFGAPVALRLLGDRPIDAAWFADARGVALGLFLRLPALVLVLAGANGVLASPRAPVGTLVAAAEIVVGLVVLAQTALPLAGAFVFASTMYLFATSWAAGVEALPLLGAAWVYARAPWGRSAPELDPALWRVLRLSLGAAWLARAALELYAYQGTAGLHGGFGLDQAFVAPLAMGSPQGFERETFVVALALTHALGGALLLAGAFTRATCVCLALASVRLLVHGSAGDRVLDLQLVAGLAALFFAADLRSELPTQRGVRIGAAVACAAAAVVPLLYGFSWMDRR
jgi:hypothetical protein